MPFDAETGKLDLIAQLIALSDAPGDADMPAPAFLRAFYRDVASEHMVTRPRADLLAAARSLWNFMALRPAGMARVRVIEQAAWTPARSVIEIVNDDMPFLVDSIAAAVNRHGPAVHHLIHPILTVTRDPKGHLLSLEGDLKESVMQIELTAAIDAHQVPELQRRIEAVLADVRAIVIDWSAMRQQAEAMADAMAAGHLPLGIAEVTETASFLAWLADENFTFLGYRDYALEGDRFRIVSGSGRGLLRDEGFVVFEEIRGMRRLPEDVRHFLDGSRLMTISKARRRSPVHRPVPFETIVIKRFDADGQVAGLHLLIGLFTSNSYARPPASIPVLRNKVARCMARAGFAAGSHDEKALQHILDSYPRDELFQIDEHQLLPIALGILHLQQRPRIALYLRRDPFGRFASCLVFLPRERYDEPLRERCKTILAEAFGGTVAHDTTHLDDASALARLHVTIDAPQDQPLPDIDPGRLEQLLVDAARTWADHLADAITETYGEAAAPCLLHRYAGALPGGYAARFSPASAMQDIAQIERVLAGTGLALSLYRGGEADTALTLKLFHALMPVALSDVLPILENLGLRVITEIPYECQPLDAARVIIQEFEVAPRDGGVVDLAETGGAFEEALPLIWSGALENDGFNRLILGAGLTGRQIVVLRTYCKIIRQAGSNFSQAYMEEALARYPDLAHLLIDLFEARFDPALGGDRQSTVDRLSADIAAALEDVANLDDDRILRGFLLLIQHSLRTNYYQRTTEGSPKPYLAIKLASREIDLFPLPRPLVEIYLYSPSVEGCHLRGDRVARGGIRWSDRMEDFRTEILGLMKAQVVKNAVIVPGGSKGGFVVKRPPPAREQLMAEVVRCYRTLMSALLDLTDNIDSQCIVPPADTVRHDGDDPYLVVAADKGTATFSDIANGVAAEYGFWLGDAFASGGSVGYDHKAMGITARGAWEAVKRHFRECGTDIQAQDFTCIGVGDMSGDVFGNGMLLSAHTKLLAAFDHRHIFIDPDPDPAASWAERKRLFALPRSSWADYDTARLSKGGGVYPRGAKSITLRQEAAERFGLPREPISPPLLIRHLLTQPVEFLWFGGIGTYVKGSAESHADAGDRANDALRVDGAALQAKVVGEGANLAMTQRGRIDYALKGGRLNTDAIDNSAGVDTSDHEVNIKIAVGNMIAAGHLPPEERPALLAEMTGEVADLVLQDNYLQTAALSVAEAQGARLVDQHVRLMRMLEHDGHLDRAIEFLPDDQNLAQRAAARRGLTRPELAVLLAYAKNSLNEELVSSSLPDDPAFEADLAAYFPAAIRDRARGDLRTHRLSREIIATRLANEVINRLGPGFVSELRIKTGRPAADIVRAYRIAAEIFDFARIWREIEAGDGMVSAASQVRLQIDVAAVAERAIGWLLDHEQSLDIRACVAAYRPGVATVAARLPGLLPEGERRGFGLRIQRFTGSGVPDDMVRRVVALANLAAALDIVRLAGRSEADVIAVAALYYQTGERFALDTLRDAARELPAGSAWQQLAAAAVLDDFYYIQSEIAGRALGAGAADPALDPWIRDRPEAMARLDDMIADVTRATAPDLAMLTVIARQLRALI